MAGQGIIDIAIAQARTRASWNDRLAHWERPASDHEEAKIERAAAQARAIVAANAWLTCEQATVVPQGSYHNNTNVRLEADMDLRVQLDYINTVYLDGLDASSVGQQLGYYGTGKSFAWLAAKARQELEQSLVAYYGHAAVDASGNKAIRVHGLDGSRADCDLVPAFHLHVISRGLGGVPGAIYGVAILGKDGTWTYNFPEHHHENGKVKRGRTAHRFKKCVRMLKQLNYELAELGEIPKRMPSFFIECLVYAVDDAYFLYEVDDRYSRLIRILNQMRLLLSNAAWCQTAKEINGIKDLFHYGQAWDRVSALAFVHAALARLRA